MHTIGSILQHNQIVSDINTKTCDELGNQSVFFNVNKVYTELDFFTFEGTLQIKCGSTFSLKVIQLLQTVFTQRTFGLTTENFEEIILLLFRNSIYHLQEHIENSKGQMPGIAINNEPLNQYLLSWNYQDLYKSCFVD